jgi:hypothetical protein
MDVLTVASHEKSPGNKEWEKVGGGGWYYSACAIRLFLFQTHCPPTVTTSAAHCAREVLQRCATFCDRVQRCRSCPLQSQGTSRSAGTTGRTLFNEYRIPTLRVKVTNVEGSPPVSVYKLSIKIGLVYSKRMKERKLKMPTAQQKFIATLHMYNGHVACDLGHKYMQYLQMNTSYLEVSILLILVKSTRINHQRF